MSASDLKSLVVDAFPLSKTRATLWQAFDKFIQELKAADLHCDVWLDGSFLTKKIDPDDVDFVLDFPVSVLDAVDITQAALVNKISKQGFKTQKLHSFVIYSAPVIDLRHAESLHLHNQWERDFGFSYVKKEPKGIAVMEVSP